MDRQVSRRVSTVSMFNRPQLNRRRFLRSTVGGLGTALALPPLASMFRSETAFAVEAGGLPRFLAIYQPNGHQLPNYLPDENLNFGDANTAPLEPWMDHVTILAGLEGTHSATQGDKAHGSALLCWLTGKPVPTAKDKRHSISADTFIAKRYEERAPNGRSQQLSLVGSPYWEPPESGDHKNKEFNDWLTSDQNGNKILPTPDLQKVFDEMFAGFDASATQEQLAARRAYDKSVIDYVMEDVRQVEARLGSADKQILGSYLNDVRTLEQRLAQPNPGVTAGGCGEADFQTSRKWPTERENRALNPYIDEHYRDTMQLLKVAFQCEAVRSVGYLIEAEGGESGYENHGLGNSHGAAHNNRPDYGKRDRLHAELFVELMEMFQQTPVGDSNLLESTMMMWGAGAGFNHAANGQSTVLAGYSGTAAMPINHGRLHQFDNKASAIPLMRSLMLHMGVIDESESFGDAGPGDIIDLS